MIFQGKLFRVERASALLPDGRRMTYERVVRVGCASILAVDAKGRVLLLREYIDKENGYQLVLPAGKLDKRGETPVAAARRELREETGMRAQNMKLFFHSTGGRTLVLPFYAFLATGLSSAPLVSSDNEDIKVIPTPLKKAFRMAATGKLYDEINAYLIMRLYLQRKRYLK